MDLVNDYELKEYIEKGNSPESYAERTGFAVDTIRKHLYTMAETENIDITKIVSEEEMKVIINILSKVKWDGTMTLMYQILEGKYPYYKIKLLLHSRKFLNTLTDVYETLHPQWDKYYIAHLKYANEHNKRKKDMQLPGIYVYFIFNKPIDEDDSGLMFIDVTDKLGKVIQDSKKTADKLGYIEVKTKEDGKAIAKYYTASMSPRYPSYKAEDNAIISIDEMKLKPKMLFFDPSKNRGAI